MDQSEEHYRRLIELSPDAVFIQYNGECLYANAAGAELLGARDVSELIGKPIVDVVVPSRWENAKTWIQELIEGTSAPRIEKKFVRLDGTTVDVEVAAIPFTYRGKQAIQLVAHDITRRRRAEEQLRASEELFRSLVKASPLGIMVLDTAGSIKTINPSMLKILGSPSQEDAMQISPLTFQPLMEDGIFDSIRQCLETGESKISEHPHTSIGGKTVWLRFYVSPLTTGNGRSTGVLALVEDITKRKRVEGELLEKDMRIQRELQLANAIQSSLFPINLPQVSGVTLAATAVSANEVGGDYCDLFVTKHNKLGIAIGDVMGKGVPAALFVAMTYAFVRNHALELDEPSPLVNRVNRGLFPQLELTQQFITFFYGIYDPASRDLVYTNAGHNPPLVYRAATAECEPLPVRDFIMGGMLEARYREGVIALCPGDVVLFYTDGLKEGRNPEKEQFGLERMMRCIKENHAYDPASIEEIMSCEFTEFLDGEPPYDDVTMIVIKIDG